MRLFQEFIQLVLRAPLLSIARCLGRSPARRAIPLVMGIMGQELSQVLLEASQELPIEF
jgi:hypothetical protein